MAHNCATAQWLKITMQTVITATSSKMFFMSFSAISINVVTCETWRNDTIYVASCDC